MKTGVACVPQESVKALLIWPMTRQSKAGKCVSNFDFDIDFSFIVTSRYPGLIFQNYDSPMKTPTIVNNGHSSK